MTQPLMARLQARGELISVAALPWVAPVYRAMPQVSEVIDLPFAHGRLDWAKRRAVAASLKGRFDAALVLPNSIKAALIPWLAGIPERIGYQGEGRWLLLNKRSPNPSGRPPMVAFYSALADAKGGSANDEVNSVRPPLLHLDASVLKQATAAVGVQAESYWVFAPGAEYGPAKCWPAARYAELARSLYAAHGLPVLLLGSGKEAALCEEISNAAPGACRVLAGKTSLIDAMALIAAARGMVSNDSGLMHVAAAFGLPQVAVFGSTSPEHTPPLNARAQVIWLKQELKLDCMPCFERTCRFGHTRCLTEVSAQRVEEGLEVMLGVTI